MRPHALLALALTLGIPCLAHAQPAPDEEFRLGREAMNRRDYKQALALLRDSQAKEPGKGKLLNIALCEEQLGLFGSALRHFQDLIPQFPPGDERAFIAKQHAAAVEPRAPRLTITLAPDAPAGTTVALDGEALPPSSLGTALPLDAGPHMVTATAPGRSKRSHPLQIADAERKQILVSPGAAGREDDPPTTPTPTADPAPPAARPLPFKLGIAAASAGGAALLAGMGVGIAALGKRSTLADHCDADRTCPASQQGTINAYHTLGGASSGLIIGGAVLAAGGAVLIAISPRLKPPATGWIQPDIGLGSAGLRGRF